MLFQLSKDTFCSSSDVSDGHASDNVGAVDVLDSWISGHSDSNLTLYDTDFGPPRTNSSGKLPAFLADSFSSRHRDFLFLDVAQDICAIAITVI